MNEETIKKFYSLLLNRKYQQIESLTDCNRLSAKQIADIVKDYGRTIVPYPEKIKFDVIKVEKADSEEWSVVAPIYTLEEGLSDLSIELTLIKNGPDSFKIELDNIHVR